MRLRQLGHGRVVRLDLFIAHAPCDSGNIVGSRQHDEHLGMQIDYVLAKAHQHLWRGLPIDAAIDVRFARKIVRQLPVVGDGIADEDDAILSGRWLSKRSVGFAIAFQFAEIVGVYGDARGAVLIETGKTVEGMAGAGCWAKAETVSNTTDKNFTVLKNVRVAMCNPNRNGYLHYTKYCGVL